MKTQQQAHNSSATAQNPRISRFGWRPPRQRSPIRVLAAVEAAEPAIDFVRLNPGVVAHLYERDWRTVDQLRDRVDAEGLSDRISVRIIEAMSFINPRDYDIVLSARDTWR